MANRWGNNGNSDRLFTWAPKSLWMVTAARKLKELLAPWKKSNDKPRQHIKKQRHFFAYKAPQSQSYGFSSSHVWIWELDNKKGWVPKNWCLQTVVLEKTLESPLDSKIKPVNPKGNQSWIFIGRTDAEAEAPILWPLWPLYAKSWLTEKYPDARKDWRQEEKGTPEDEMVGWHHWIMDMSLSKLREMVMDREAWHASRSPRGCKESDTTEWLNKTLTWESRLVVS